MFPIIFVVGKSGAGKTTLLEKLVPELKGRGYKIGVVKHCSHGFELDQPGKDSWRLSQVGEIVILISPNEVAIFRKGEPPSFKELPRYIADEIDLLLVEGYREGEVKIEVYRSDLGDLLCSPEELWAIVGDKPLNVPIPQFSWQGIRELADLIEKTFLSSKEKVELFINGSPLTLSPFVQDFIAKTITGMVSALKGGEGAKRLEIRVRQ